MKLSIADKLAILYSREGSQRKVAAVTGLSHQQVGRILHNAAQGKSNAYFEGADWIVGGVDHAIEMQRKALREVARKQGIPYTGEIPIFATRLELRNRVVRVDGKDIFRGPPDEVADLLKGRPVKREYKDKSGREQTRIYRLSREQIAGAQIVRQLGDRVGSEHTHWVSDKLRAAWLARQQKTGAYYVVTVGSIVNLPEYMKSARHRIKEYMRQGGLSNADREAAREQLEKLNKGYAANQIEKQDRTAIIYTPHTTMDRAFAPALLAADIKAKLAQRHEPATGLPGTSLASSVIMQLDTRPAHVAKQTQTRAKSRGKSAAGSPAKTSRRSR